MTFISIIIPFNSAQRYLRDCLDSISEEKLDDAEIILISNGIDEPLDEFLEDYEDLNIKRIDFKDNIGVARARNIGIENAQGEYVYFIDCDDYVDKDSLNKLIQAAKSTKADFVNGERITTPYIIFINIIT